MALRRRDDADVQVLLWEIRRMHEVFAEVADLWLSVPKVYIDDLEPAKRLSAILTKESAIARQKPKAARALVPPIVRGRPKRDPPTENEDDRRARIGVADDGTEDAKLWSKRNEVPIRKIEGSREESR